MCRINKNNNTYRLSNPSKHLSGRQKVKRAVTQYWTRNTWNMTEASWCIYTLICPLTGPATNHCPGNGLGHFRIVERLNVHIISPQLVIHYYTCEHWLIATEPSIEFQQLVLKYNCDYCSISLLFLTFVSVYMYVFTWPLWFWQDVTQGLFLSGVKLVWILSFTKTGCLT